MSKLQSISNGLRVGDWVRVALGPRKVHGLIVEDRGNIGTRGQRLFVVEVPSDPAEPLTIEVAEPEVEAIARDSPEKLKMLRFLKQGGLLNILRSNTSGGRDQPRVWLRYDTLGNVTHTFTERHGQVGGRRVPFLSLHRDRIFRPKMQEVREFLESFGLSGGEAEDVIRSIGTTP